MVGFKPRELPAALRVDWFWLIVADVVEEFLRSKFHWDRLSGLVNFSIVWSLGGVSRMRRPDLFDADESPEGTDSHADSAGWI